jgi:hypothetical protein
MNNRWKTASPFGKASLLRNTSITIPEYHKPYVHALAFMRISIWYDIGMTKRMPLSAAYSFISRLLPEGAFFNLYFYL